MKRISIVLFILGWFTAAAQPADTLRLTIEEADSIFISRNLLLLSQEFNVSAQEALVRQARAYPNPIVSASLNLVDPEHKEFVNVGAAGQKEFGIQQLLVLGGKRQTAILQARQNHEIAVLEFDELLRNLRFQLHYSFYTLNKHRNIISSYNDQLRVLNQIIASYEEQATKGNIPMKDVIRLKSIYLRISNEKLELVTAQNDEVSRLQVLLRMNSYPVPLVNESLFQSLRDLPTLEALVALSLDNRPDWQIANLENELALSNLRLQKQLPFPDALVSVGYDQRGGAFKNQVNIGVAVPIPTFDRNRGNIRAAAYGQKRAALNTDQKFIELESEVRVAWQNMDIAIREYSDAMRLYSLDFTEVFNGMNENFRRRNLSILEFVDFFEAYNEALATIQRFRAQLAIASEQINFIAGTRIY